MAGQDFGDDVWPDSLTGPFVPALDEFPPILLQKSQDRHPLHAQYSGKLAEEAGINVAGLLEPDNLVGNRA
jgi:hypothetical protein